MHFLTSAGEEIVEISFNGEVFSAQVVLAGKRRRLMNIARKKICWREKQVQEQERANQINHSKLARIHCRGSSPPKSQMLNVEGKIVSSFLPSSHPSASCGSGLVSKSQSLRFHRLEWPVGGSFHTFELFLFSPGQRTDLRSKENIQPLLHCSSSGIEKVIRLLLSLLFL